MRRMLRRMFKSNVAERLAAATGLAPVDRPARRFFSLGLVATVLAAVVGLMTLYAGIRELAQPDSVDQDVAAETLMRIAPAAGSSKLMSIDEIRRLSDDN
jgi:hypothetical protein